MFKSKQFLLISLCVCIVLTLTISTFSKYEDNMDKLEMNPLPQTGSQGYFDKLEIDCDIPEIPSKMKVYKVKDLNLSKDVINNLASKLGLKGRVKENKREYAITDGTRSFTLDKNTGSYNYYTEKLADAIVPLSTLLTDQEYMMLAEEFLNEKDLMKQDAFFNKILRHTVGKINEPEKVCLVEAVFTKKLNGIKFSGVGPRISVFFGENGEIIGAFSVWKEVEEYESYPIIDTQKAVKNIIDKKAVIANVGQGDAGNVKNMEIIYDMESVRSNQKFVIPYFLLTGECQNDKEFAALTRAIPEEFIAETKLDDTSNSLHNNGVENSKQIAIPKRQDQK